MKTTSLSITLLLLLFATVVQAQTKPVKKTTTTTKQKTAPKPAPATVRGKEVTITLKSDAEKNISVFAGPKEELKTGPLKEVGGLSKNTLYVRENDIVCIMADGRKPLSCVDIKPGTTALEINSSGTVITRK